MRDSKTRLKNTTRERDDDDDVAYKGIALHNCVLHGEGFANVVDCWARGRSGSLVLLFFTFISKFSHVLWRVDTHL